MPRADTSGVPHSTLDPDRGYYGGLRTHGREWAASMTRTAGQVAWLLRETGGRRGCGGARLSQPQRPGVPSTRSCGFDAGLFSWLLRLRQPCSAVADRLLWGCGRNAGAGRFGDIGPAVNVLAGWCLGFVSGFGFRFSDLSPQRSVVLSRFAWVEYRASALRTARIPKTRFAPQWQVGPRQSRKAKILRSVGYGPVILPSKAAKNLDLSRPGAGSWPGRSSPHQRCSLPDESRRKI